MTIPLLDLGGPISAPEDSPPGLGAELAPAEVPLALLPVRLETRFFATDDATTELRVRVYPDQIHIDSHDSRLGVEELALGRRYWELRWRAAGDGERLLSAWRLLADRFEPERAAWIVRRTEPTNQDDRPTAPLGADAPLATPPRFADLGEPAAHPRTPQAGALPRRWVVTAYRDGATVAVATGNDIVADLNVGPDAAGDLAPGADDPASLAVDEGMRWMVDFDRAEEVGMALRLSLPMPIDAAGVDVLVVVGVGDDEPERGAERLAALLDAHRYTDGLAFVEPGTPTNNSAEQRAGYASRDRGAEVSFALEWAPAPPLGPGTSAERLGTALGLDAGRVDAVFGRTAGAVGTDEAVAEALQTAVWPATWGYYLSQFAPGLGEVSRAWARDHARRFLRPGGALPTLRCGRQPYGVLPVTALVEPVERGDAAGDAARLAALGQLLVRLRDAVWRPSTIGAARVGRSDDVDADLADVLRREAASQAFAVRRALGPQYLRHLRRFLGEDLDGNGFFARLRQLTAHLTDRVGIPGVLTLEQFVHEGASSRLGRPLVRDADGTMSSIAALLSASAEALALPVPATAPSLLHALLRHGLLREQAEAAARMLAGSNGDLAALLTDAELVDLAPSPGPTPTWRWQRSQPAPGTEPPDPAETVGERLDRATDFSDPARRPLGEVREAIARLAACDPAAVERLLPAVLDATSHRLDAWVTSVATRRLAEMRASQPTGVLLGGYGWLEGLRPRGAAPAEDPGFILAPSLDQATTAALLREAHLANGGGDGAYAIQLTSDRVRLAERLFDGVRQGIPLGTLLGYDVERRLHDAGLDEFIDDVRRLAPPAGSDGERAVAARQQVDGLVLHAKWRDDRDGVLAGFGGLAEGDPRRERVSDVLGWLDRAVDAAADAITAEGVHQFARGNLARAATLDDVAEGVAPPPQLEFMRTPRTGTAITHRVAIVLDAAARVAPASGWPDSAASPRARAEPHLDAWAARLLGPAAEVDVVVAELDGAGEAVATHRVPLADLGLCALDLVWMSGDAGVATELARLAYGAAVPEPASVPVGLRLVLDPAPERAERDVGDVLEVAGGLRRLLAGARPLDGADLQPAHADPQRGVDLDELEARVDAAVQALAARRDALQDLLGQPVPQLGALRAELRAAAAFGVSAGAGPAGGAATDAAPPGSAAFITASAVFADLDRRLADAARDGAGPPDEPDTTRRDRLLRRLRSVFGPGFVAVPVFRALTAPDLDAGRRSPALLADDPLGAHTWLTRMERVRPPLARMTIPYRLAAVLGSAPALALEVAHVPHLDDRPWVGVSVDTAAEGIGPDGIASIVLVGAADVDLAAPLTGVLVDEWVEVVPDRTETAGLAFRYEPPDAMAPQAVLLAVSPEPTRPWTVGRLNRVLLETLELAHLRAVGAEAVDAVQHYLPAAMLAFNADGDAVSTDPNALIDGEAG